MAISVWVGGRDGDGEGRQRGDIGKRGRKGMVKGHRGERWGKETEEGNEEGRQRAEMEKGDRGESW